MILTDKLQKELLTLNKEINIILKSNTVTDYRLESFLKQLEKSRFNILAEINTYNNSVDFDVEKIHTIDADYKADISSKTLKIFIPETISSYKKINRHTSKRILFNVSSITKKFKGLFKDPVIVYIKVFDNFENWDIDNKNIKPILDALVLSGVIPDDNINKMFYCVKGTYSDKPHTEVEVKESKFFKDF